MKLKQFEKIHCFVKVEYAVYNKKDYSMFEKGKTEYLQEITRFSVDYIDNDVKAVMENITKRQNYEAAGADVLLMSLNSVTGFVEVAIGI